MRHFKTTPTAAFIFYRSYSRWSGKARESWMAMVDRCVTGLAELGKLTEDEIYLLQDEFDDSTALPSGRYMWCGGTDWSSKQQNYEGSYNCSGNVVDDINVFGRIMDLSMKGSGCGAVLELDAIAKLPPIKTKLNIEIVGEIGTSPSDNREQETRSRIYGDTIELVVGDSRRGWVESYVGLIQLAVSDVPGGELTVRVHLSNIRPSGERLIGFGGTANPVKLPELYGKVAAILNGAISRQLNSVECCLLICEAAAVVVAGNIRRSALIFQFSADDLLARGIKDNLWAQHDDGIWYMPNPALSSLVMGNHTTVFHTKPTLTECIDSVRKQYYSGEGAIQWAGEAVARANADLLDTLQLKITFLKLYNEDRDKSSSFLDYCHYMSNNGKWMNEFELNHRMGRYNLNPCLWGGTMVVTQDRGHQRIDRLIDAPCKIWDGSTWTEVQFQITGVNQKVYEVDLSHGGSVIATRNHEFVMADGSKIKLEDLKGGESLMLYPSVDCSRNGEMQLPAITVIGIHLHGEVSQVYCCNVPTTHNFALSCGVMIGNCGEIISKDFVCNLSEVHLNTINPFDFEAQVSAFKAASLSVAALLHHEFEIPRYQKSRELDPIVGVSFTGLFDFFVHLFGIEWLKWWQNGRPQFWGPPTDVRCDSRLRELVEADFIRQFHFDSLSQMFLAIEKEYLCSWKAIVFDTIAEYCERHGLKTPNRATTCQPAGCLTADAVRVFDQGLLYADEHMIQGSGDVDVSSSNLSVRNGIGVSCGIANQQLPLIEVVLKNGRQIKMTTNHRLFIDGEWIEASEMLPGMSIDFKLGSYTNTENVLLDRVGLAVNNIGRPCTQISTPTHMSEDLAYFVGAMYGNGSVEHLKKRVVFTHGSTEVLSKIEAIGLDLFGLTCVRKKGSRGGNFEHIVFSSSQLYYWLKVQGLLKECRSMELNRIPLSIRMSSVNSIISFIAGMIDTDGCISDGGNGVEMYSSSELYMRSVQQVSEAIGLSWSIKSRKQKGTFSGQDVWKLYLSRYHSNQESIATLNRMSVKAIKFPIVQSVKKLSTNPYQIVSTNLIESDYTYDYSVNGVDDHDSWYWQGALKSHNSKSLLTGASCGWHPPKASRYIRRMTFGKGEPIALAAIDMGYSVIPSQSDKDENGNLLDDIHDPRVTEWLVEIPCATSWADMPGVDAIDISQFSALAQFDFYMQVQRYYSTHTTSATIELREHEIEPLATAIYEDIQNDGGYMSAALLARFDSLETFPRMPFEPISKDVYDDALVAIAMRRVESDFDVALAKHDRGQTAESGPSGCDSDKCLIGGDRR